MISLTITALLVSWCAYWAVKIFRIKNELTYWKEECNTILKQMELSEKPRVKVVASKAVPDFQRLHDDNLWDAWRHEMITGTGFVERYGQDSEESDMNCRFDGGGPHPADQIEWKGVQTVYAKFERKLGGKYGYLILGVTCSSITEHMKLVTIYEFRKQVKALEVNGFSFKGLSDEDNID